MPPPDLSDLDRLTPRRERKLRDMRPMEIALAAENAFLQRRMALDGWLETISVADSGAPLTRYADIVAKIVRYAHRGPEEGVTPSYIQEQAVAVLTDLLTCPIAPSVGDLERIDPYLSDLVTVCCAALGRYRLEEEHKPIPDGWLAAMANVTTATIRSYISDHRDWAVQLKRPKGETWLVTVGTATRFLAHRATAEGTR